MGQTITEAGYYRASPALQARLTTALAVGVTHVEIEDGDLVPVDVPQVYGNDVYLRAGSVITNVGAAPQPFRAL